MVTIYLNNNNNNNSKEGDGGIKHSCHCKLGFDNSTRS